jgi:hypothetical protein
MQKPRCQKLPVNILYTHQRNQGYNAWIIPRYFWIFPRCDLFIAMCDCFAELYFFLLVIV